MKTRTSIHAGVGPQGCSPETQHFMQRALEMQRKVENCLAQGSGSVNPPWVGNIIPPNNGGSLIGSAYPDRSGWCG